ncbi:hypothetical protein GR160_17235 [Flavobacterium sp. Sd200]|uniref:type II toxin-antitoxin system HicA family toxin n=1 Tax=Flavobacterium sp. Sd200 TaxID=2692211 RepID=UPI00136AE944|nr:hypothetical protein [Flavobacterium sp. Sd200]MXN92972.1 hypothetical protein [Flavobacterium sp. Sd200]
MKKTVTVSKVIPILDKYGYKYMKTTGNHNVYKNDDVDSQIVIPSTDRIISQSTLASIKRHIVSNGVASNETFERDLDLAM